MRSEWKISFSLLSPGLTYANSLGVNTLHALTCAMDVLSQGRRREDCPYDDSCGFSQTFLHTCALLPLSPIPRRAHSKSIAASLRDAQTDALQLDEFAPRSEGGYNRRTPAPRFDYG